ncbi:MAG: RNB domain-containing ribonuclease, partial [Bacilli bacterium]|nr:RNB domain-containing ribonuclease [Bacilli bacterium]
MEELMDYIAEYLDSTRKIVSKNDLKDLLSIKHEQTEIFDRALNALVENGRLFLNGKNQYESFKNRPYLVSGRLCMDKEGNTYIRCENKYNIMIKECDLNGARIGDIVIVDRGQKERKHSKLKFGQVTKVLKRKNPDLTYRVIGNGPAARIVAPEGFETNIAIKLKDSERAKLRDGDYVLITIGDHITGNKYYGEVKKVIEKNSYNKLDTILVAEKYGRSTMFSDEVLKEAAAIPQTISEEELIGRIDLRDKNILTIDCDNTKDRDDAVYVERLDNGNYKLYVNISHVTHYVKEGSEIYKEAARRAMSFYHNDDCIEMLPRSLSSGICSLNEDVDRLTRTFEMEIKSNGEIIESSFKAYQSVIRSKRQMAYSKVNSVLDGKSVPGYDEFKDSLVLMNELSKLLGKKRNENDYLDINKDELEFKRDDDGNIISIGTRSRGDAEKLIENFMVLTNAWASVHFHWLPIIYRVHDKPDIDSIKNLIAVLNEAGVHIRLKGEITEANCKKVLIYIAQELDKRENSDYLKELAVQSLKRAVYSTTNISHFALGVFSYGTFTSPIRKYVDLENHSMLDKVDAGTFDMEQKEKYEKKLAKACAYVNSVQKIAFDMERDAETMNIAKFAKSHIGDEFK